MMPKSKAVRMAAVAVAVAVVAVAAAVIWSATRTDAYEFKGGEITPPRAAPPLDLTDQNGQPFTLSQEEGNVLLVYFGYTTCPDLCPTTLNDFAIVKEELGEDGAKVRYVMVTFDPERDTLARMREYLGFFDPDFIGLRGSDEQTEAFKQAYGVTTKRVEYPESATKYLIDHSALIYVVDTEGRLRLTYTYGTDPMAIVEDMRHLVDE
jgi:protein SCO1/2